MLFFVCFLFVPHVFAADYSSASYTVMDPVLMPAGYATSASYSLTSTVAQIAIGTSTSAAWEDRSGFEYFPFMSTPALSASAGDAQALLSWTAAVGVLGWTVSGYDIGQATVSGGPYSYTNVGAVLSSTRTGLTNGTTYYFVVRARDAFGNPIATSSEATATPTGSAPQPGGGGGGGGGPYVPPAAEGTLNVSGRAYTEGMVVLLVDAAIQKTVELDGNANWSAMLPLDRGAHQFSAYATDFLGRRSALFGTSVVIPSGGAATLGGIFLSPTLASDKEQAERGVPVALSGTAYPESDVVIMYGPDPLFVDGVRMTRVPAAPDGRYTYRLETGDLRDETRYYVRSRASWRGETSALSRPISFRVAKPTIHRGDACMPGDLNGDLRVNLTDFSIAVYWYKRSFSEIFADKEKRCLNNDGKVDLYDFSLMAYYWTG